MNHTTVLTLASLAAVTVAAPVAIAAPPKPITKTYTATAPLPDPTNFAGGGYSVCAQAVPQSFHIEEFEVPAAGSLKVTLTGFVGDWDLLLMDGKDREMASSGELPATDEVTQIKFKKPGLVKIVACNWAGGPTGEVTYTFTFAGKK